MQRILDKEWIHSERLSQLNYLKPEYLAGKGDVTRCGFSTTGPETEEFYDVRPIGKVVDQLLLQFGKSRRAMNMSLQKHLDRMRNQPLVLNAHLVLVPVKSRKERIARDTATGFLVLSQIANILPDPEVTAGCWIFFKDATTLQAYHSMKTVRENMRNARHAEMAFNDQQGWGTRGPQPNGYFSF